MKYIFLLIFIVGCSTPPYHHKPVITSKYLLDFNGNPLPKGFCRYWYSVEGNTSIEFMDSVGKYDIGDTIVGKIKN